MLSVAVAAALAAAGMRPAPAQAHGPIAPVALDYLAHVTHLPHGLDAKVVDGDQQMWLRVPAHATVVVLDYRGAPYLRFSAAGVEINENSEMYYLNQTPFALPPPAGLQRTTPPKWERVSAARQYSWHDGRLHALAAVALRPGTAFVGSWRVPVVIDGRLSAITGGLWHADPPSIVWLWPIVVLALCTVAAWRVRSPELDRRTARLLALGALGAVAAAGVGQELHGRPEVSVLQLVALALILAFVLWMLLRVLTQRAGFFAHFLIAIAALWQGLELIPTLFNGFVLIALPAFVARTATVVALGTAGGLLLMAFRLFDRQLDSSPTEGREREDARAWEPA